MLLWQTVRLDPRRVREVLGTGEAPAFRGSFSRLVAWAAIILAALAVGYLGLQFATGSQASAEYVTEPVETGNLTVIVTATGSVQPTNVVEVSSELSGLIREVLVDFNDQVSKGQPLAKLDTDKLSATVENSRAKLNAARAKAQETLATIEERRDDYQRKQAMSAKQLISVQDLVASKSAYDRAVASRASALAEVEVARADLRLNETNLSKACICAPISGVVLARNVEPGQTVAATYRPRFCSRSPRISSAWSFRSHWTKPMSARSGRDKRPASGSMHTLIGSFRPKSGRSISRPKPSKGSSPIK